MGVGVRELGGWLRELMGVGVGWVVERVVREGSVV